MTTASVCFCARGGERVECPAHPTPFPSANLARLMLLDAGIAGDEADAAMATAAWEGANLSVRTPGTLTSVAGTVVQR